MFNRIKRSLVNARSGARRFKDDEQGVVMVEWVALAGIFVAILVVTFLAIGDKANVVVETVDGQLGQITASLGSGGGTGTGT
jgi:Flp pilus assembly pilin Flp